MAEIPFVESEIERPRLAPGPVGSAGPDEGEAAGALDQAGEDRCRETRIVELDREIGVTILGGGGPGRSDLRRSRVDPEIRGLVVIASDGGDVHLGLQDRKSTRLNSSH